MSADISVAEISHTRTKTISQRLAETNYLPSGFDYLRIGLAVAVVAWHSYGMTNTTPDIMNVWQGPVGFLVEAIVPAFFALSGFLVCGSLERNSDLKRFLALRVIRIYPALGRELITVKASIAAAGTRM